MKSKLILSALCITAVGFGIWYFFFKPEGHIPPILIYNGSVTDTALFAPAQSLCSLQTKEVLEASSVVASRNFANAVWTANDSGGENTIFLLNEKGEKLAKYLVKGAKAADWEEMSSFTDTVLKKNYLYVMDMGDNFSKRDTLFIYKFLEPINENKEFPFVADIEAVETIRVKYPDGRHDCEALLADPFTGALTAITKREDSIRVYSIPSPKNNEIVEMQYQSSLSFNLAVGGSVSADGKEILLKTYRQVLYWQRIGNEPLYETLKRLPATLPYKPEPQGEAIAWKIDGSGFYTLSEEVGGTPQHLYFHKRK